MQCFNLPSKITTLIFDIDGTLYTSSAYVQEQIDVQIRHWAKLTGQTEKEARKKISAFRKNYAETHGGKKISLGNTFTHFGISIEESIEWRNKILEPEKFLEPNLELKKILAELKNRYKMICLTNNPVEAAFRTLKAVGINEEIPLIIGLDTLKLSKPNKELLDLACKETSSEYNECVSIGDRYDIDLSLAIELGMGGVLVKDVGGVIQFAREKLL